MKKAQNIIKSNNLEVKKMKRYNAEIIRTQELDTLIKNRTKKILSLIYLKVNIILETENNSLFEYAVQLKKMQRCKNILIAT